MISGFKFALLHSSASIQKYHGQSLLYAVLLLGMPLPNSARFSLMKQAAQSLPCNICEKSKDARLLLMVGK